MIKKVLIAGLFLGGGYFIIKKLLPTNKLSELDEELLSQDDAIELERQKAIALGKKVQEALRNRNLINSDGTMNENFERTMFLNPTTMFQNMTEEQKQNLRQSLIDNGMPEYGSIQESIANRIRDNVAGIGTGLNVFALQGNNTDNNQNFPMNFSFPNDFSMN